MSQSTQTLGLYKHEVINDAEQLFDIDKALNANWDKLDANAKEVKQTLQNLSNSLSTHNSATDSHNDIRLLINALSSGKISATDIINNLTSNVTNKPLSAAQGVTLKALIDAIPAWAKASTKPTYTPSEIGAPTNFIKQIYGDVSLLDDALTEGHYGFLDSSGAFGYKGGWYDVNVSKIVYQGVHNGYSQTARRIYPNTRPAIFERTYYYSPGGWNDWVRVLTTSGINDEITFENTLYLTKNVDTVGTKDMRPALIIGPAEGIHIEYDVNEIIAKGSATTGYTLAFNSSGGGLVQVGYPKEVFDTDGVTKVQEPANFVTYGTITGNTIHSLGADYAELFKWEDDNLNNEDRSRLFVTLEKDRIKIASSGDYIAGIVSINPCILGNFIYEVDEKGNVLKDPSISPIGLVGILEARDDGTCQVNKFCQVADGGIATHCETYIPGMSYRVLDRIDENTIKVLFK